MHILYTPEDRFAKLPGYPFAPQFVEVAEGLRMHYLDEGPAEGQAILLLHGEPSWSYLYRKMIPPLTQAGFRCIAPDLVGFGKSGKPSRQEDYSYAAHLQWLRTALEEILPAGAALFCQDWGGLLGLRLLAEQPDRFSAVVAANTFLPAGDQPVPDAFLQWQAFAQSVPQFPVGNVVNMGTATALPPEVMAAYDAPFPEERFKSGARIFPALVPVSPEEPEARANREAWKALEQWEKPFLTLFGDSDPITRGAEKVLQARIPGAQEQPHAILEQAGHFIQEDQGRVLARHVIDFLSD
jgi:haloalkane dehalogenase